MDYLENRKEAYQHPRGVLEGARSVVMLGMNYFNERPTQEPEVLKLEIDRPHKNHSPPKIARYVWSGIDYHDLIHKKLKAIKKAILEDFPEWNVRGVVDTAPLLERDFAMLSGLGWQGKNTMLINKRHGSYFFLSALLIDQDLTYDPPHEETHCGTCTECLTACPTDAFVEAGKMDARKCISYWTIESKELAPPELLQQFGDWFFGCDVCQEVCPWNRHSSQTTVPQLERDESFVDLKLERFFDMSEEEFRREYRKTPFWRSRLEGMQRNAAIVWGNQKDRSKINVLKQGLDSKDRIVRQACKWALDKMDE